MGISDQDKNGGSVLNLEIQKLMNQLNRPAVKSIKFATVYATGDKYYGGKASMNIWEPTVEKHNEFSNSQLGIQNGNTSKGYDSIQAGWQVNPQLYGDNNTRLFTFWTADSGQSTGCFDMLCSGFVHLNNGVAVEASIQPLSVYGDLKSQFDIAILIWKDPINGDWWMQYGRDTVVGYWPSSLFGRLSDGATTILWGGEVLNLASEDGKHSITQMGSGHFAGEAQGRASYFRNIAIVNGKNQYAPPPNGVATYSDHVNCYNVKMASSDDELGAYFYFGGPGRNPDCP
ncbi:uncharacterized protein LOC114744831 [Neltuma alba]|uniref:uncharacterized protein LOC114744831 n=1 Tax=Neltuma alba TaxID=207710 RepID=UPI0010A334E0|nr:uncharacterized protein LOC114744831 [Prosopis alba]